MVRRKLAALCVMTGAVLLAWAGCSKTASNSSSKQEQERRIEATSSVPVNRDALKRQPIPDAMKRLTRVESIGDCAPRYKIGGHGSCINNTPCRGFGVRDDAGNTVCTCYGAPGCAEGQRCDERKLVCVPEDEPLQDRMGKM
jgi:hypothetical protein